MFRHTIPIGKIFGIVVDLDYSWFLVFALLTWILAVSYFPAEIKNAGWPVYWLLGAVTAALLFLSVLLHELGHSVVARYYRLDVPRITLFIFGGVSQMAGEPPSAGAEFWIAAAGPGVSFLLAAVFALAVPFLAASGAIHALVRYLILINVVLGLFNLLPGFPLDGGRILRAIVWRISRDFRKATIFAANSGRFFGFLFIAIGVWMALRGYFFNGLWTAFIGWFLESAAVAQVQQQLVQSLLTGHKVAEAMGHDYPSIPAEMSLEEIVHDYVLRAGRTNFVVLRNSEAAGVLSLHDIRQIPRADWPQRTAEEAMVPVGKAQKISPDAELWTAIERMGRNGVDPLPVVQDSRLVGMLSRDDLVHYLGILQALRA